MPCNSDHMRANTMELELSRVACLLDEIETGRPVDPNGASWDGYHPDVYCRYPEKSTRDRWVETLCTFCRNNDVTKYSLELQIWWRDHQKVDAEREKREGI